MPMCATVAATKQMSDVNLSYIHHIAYDLSYYGIRS